MSGGDIIPLKGRRSDGMEEWDWMQLATAYDTWNNEENQNDPDVLAWCHDIFSEYDLWDYVNNEPFLGQYRQLIMQRC